MSEPLVDRIPFAKIVTVLAIVLGVSLGLCGVTFVLSSGSRGNGLFIGLGVVELAAMGLSAAGLILAVVVWVTLVVVSCFGGKVSQPQKLFDAEDDTKLDKKD